MVTVVALVFVSSSAAAPQQSPQAKSNGKPSLAVTPGESSSRPGKAGKTAPNPSGPTPAPQPLKANPPPVEYRIGVEDELQISVWGEPGLSTMVVVRPDGMITLPLLNDVHVVGLKPEELAALLGEKLKGFVNEPQVTVIVRNIRSRKVYLVGETLRQGSFPLNGEKTILELLAEAGGLGPFAKGNAIYILREEGGKKIRIPFQYKKALVGRSENIVLRPGDMVVVP